MIFPVSPGVVSLRFRYYSQTEDKWYSSWGEDPRLGLPNLVRLTIALRSSSGRISDYSTVVPLHDAEQ